MKGLRMILAVLVVLSAGCAERPCAEWRKREVMMEQCHHVGCLGPRTYTPVIVRECVKWIEENAQ